jgi:hypothetical protein
MVSTPFPAYNDNGPFIFVSYAHADRAVVFPEMIWLRQQGFNIWYDEGIAPGSKWADAIADALQRCTVFVAFITPNAAASAEVEREIHEAVNSKKPILVVFLQPAELSPGIKLRIQIYQWIEGFALGQDAYRQRMYGSISKHYRPATTISCPFCHQRYKVSSHTQRIRCTKCSNWFASEQSTTAELQRLVPHVHSTASDGGMLVQQQLDKERRAIQRLTHLRRLAIGCLACFGVASLAFALAPKDGQATLVLGILFIISNLASVWAYFFFLPRYTVRVAQERLRTADWLWDNGHKDTALSHYEDILRHLHDKEKKVDDDDSFWRIDVPRIFCILIENAIATGNVDRSRQWIQQALYLEVAVTLVSDEARIVWEQVATSRFS